MPAAARQRRARPPRDVATWPPTARRRSVPRSAVGRPKSSAGATSVLRRHAWRTPTTASSSGREGGRSRHRRLGGRASDLPATARQRAGSGGARPRPTGRVPTDALGRGLRRTRIDELKVVFQAISLNVIKRNQALGRLRTSNSLGFAQRFFGDVNPVAVLTSPGFTG
jgi:hypothetical protein